MKHFELFPRASNRAGIRFVPREFCYPSGSSRELRGEVPHAQSFLQAWFENDSWIGEENHGAHVNWGAVSGMVLSFAVSAGFWAAVVVLAQRIWK
jgi:hypothetical protein